jgi:hypothetical protein
MLGCSIYKRKNMSQNLNRNENHNADNQQQPQSQWSQIIGQVMERLMGANVSTTINFDNLEVDVPRAQGPGGRDLGGAKWTINGKIIWTTEGYKTTSHDIK